MSGVAVLDYGSQYTRLITRRLRELNVYSYILPAKTPLENILETRPSAIILSGGPTSVYDEGAPTLPEGLLAAGLPVLAICYGMQLVAQVAGGEVTPSSVREYGKAVLASYDGALFAGVEGEIVAWMSHSDSVTTPPPGFRVTATTPDTPVAAMEDVKRKLFTLQFHPEVRHTPKGTQILQNFLEEAGSSAPGHLSILLKV